MLTRTFVGIGGNLPETRQTIAHLLRRLGVQKSASSLVRSAARERQRQPDFLNSAFVFDTELGPGELLKTLKQLEVELGRDPKGERWGPRLIDLDILAMEGVCLDEPNLTIPHPRLHGRRFALEPLAELAPDLKPWAACIGDAKQDLTVAEALLEVLDQRVERIAGPEWVDEEAPFDERRRVEP